MNDIANVFTSVTTFAKANSGLLILLGLTATVLLLAWGLRRMLRSERPDKRLALISLIIGFGWSAEAMWEVATQKLDLAPGFAVFAFVIFESQLAVAMMRSERNQRLHNRPGKHGQSAWLIAVVMGCIAAAAGDSLVEVLLRLSVPLLVTHQWWVGMTGDGTTKDEDATSWTWTPRRILLALGLVKSGSRDLTTIDRQRHVKKMIRLRHRLKLATKPAVKLRLEAKLQKLAMDADPELLDEVREKITLVWDATERTRPLETHEHVLVNAARTEVEHAREQAEAATTSAEAARAELAQVRQALEHSTAVTGQAGEQIRQLQEQMQQMRRDAEAFAERAQHEATMAIDQARREATLAVEQARLDADLAIAAARTVQPANGHGHNGYASVSAAAAPGRSSITSMVPAPAGELGGDSPALPATAPACTEWMTLWVKICQEMPAVALGQPIGEDVAKATFECSVRHLRKVRAAARSGGLRNKAQELGATIPAGYIDEPRAVNGYASVS